MKWLNEQRDDHEYQTAVNRTVEQIEPENWYSMTVAALRKLVDAQLKKAQGVKALPELPNDEQIRACLDQHQLSEISELLLRDDKWQGVSMTGTLLAEAAGAIFCDRPSLPRWQMLGQLMENDPVARRVLIDLVERRMEKRPALRDEIRKVAQMIVRQSVQSPTEFAHERDFTTFQTMLAQWKAKPDLAEIWFGLRPLGYIMSSRDDLWIFDILFKADLSFAVELIEEYGDPYRPYVILEYGTFAPHRRFDDWTRLMKKALPAFEGDECWNGRVLLPLLLYIAQNKLVLSNQGHRLDNTEQIVQRDNELTELAQTVATILWSRSDGVQASLLWGGWLFRTVTSALHDERAAAPIDPQSGARVAWLIIEGLFDSPKSTAWLDILPTDVPSEDEICLQVLRLLAADEHDCSLTQRDFLLEMLPESPEEYIEGEAARRIRALPGLFTSWDARPDVLGMRMLSLELIDKDVVTRFKTLWRNTLSLREIVEHGSAFQSDKRVNEDYGWKASKAICFMLSIGINVIDHLQDPERVIASLEDRRVATQKLFAIMYDATREMLAIDRLGREKLENIHNHLCVRRVFYDDSNLGEVTFEAPLATKDAPTLGDLLYERCEIGRPFFDCLQFLRVNHIQAERIESALEDVGLQLGELVVEAQRLNAIEEKRKINLTGFEHLASTSSV